MSKNDKDRLLFPTLPYTPVYPALAEKVGVNEAIILQQLFYFYSMEKNMRDGRYWVYNTLNSWKIQFPWVDRITIHRALKSLRKQGLVEATSKYNQRKSDRMLWYTMNIDKIRALISQETFDKYKRE